MAKLIKVEHDDDKISIIVINIALLVLSFVAFLNAVTDWEKGRKGMASFMFSVSAVSAGLCDLSNRNSKSLFALDRLHNEAESRQKARSIEAQEKVLAADLSIASNRRISELKLEGAEIDANLAAQFLQLEHEYANLAAQLQEFE